MRFPTLCLLPALFAACVPASPDDDFAGLLPDDRLLVDFRSAAQAARVGDPSEHAATTAETANDIDQLIGDVITMLGEVTSYPSSWDDGSHTASWGPWEDGGIHGRLWVRELGDGGYRWALEMKPVDQPDSAFAAVARGDIAAGATEEASEGGFVIDFDAATAAGGGDGEVGRIRLDYAIDPDGAVGELRLRDFAEDVGNVEADAIVAYDTHSTGGSLEWVVRGDTSDPPNGVEERIRMSSRWDATGAGRLDAEITGGDLGELTFLESGCWDAAGAETWFENSYELEREGDEASCVFSESGLTH